MRKLKFKRKKQSINRNFLILTIILTILGLLLVADASAPSAMANFSDRFHFVRQQMISAAIGFAALIVASLVSYKIWSKLALPLFAASILLLILVLIPSFGVRSLGARRWIDLGFFSFQPSEIIKLAITVYFAKLAVSNKKTLAYILPLGFVGLAVMLQPDLGTAIVITTIGISQMFVAGVNFISLLATLTIGGFLSFILIITSDYRKDRLLTFLSFSQDPLGKSYHIRQILISLGSGGLLGVGLGQSKQKYLYLPEAATDSVFAVLAEEVGFFGSLAVIILFLMYILIGIKIAKEAPDKFSKVFAVGVISWVGGQAFVNLASMVALIPLTGIPLPFFSYGGTSLITILLATGILLNISKHAKYEKTKRK